MWLLLLVASKGFVDTSKITYAKSMLRFIQQTNGMQIKSLRSGRIAGTLTDVIINPHNLSIEAYYCIDRRKKSNLVLFANDIRQMTRDSVIINDEENILEIDDDLVRLKELLAINFQLRGKKAITDDKRKLGRIADYAIDDKSHSIEKLYISKTGLQSLGGSDLVVGRNQLAEVTDKQVVVKEATIKNGNSKKLRSNPILGPQAQ